VNTDREQYLQALAGPRETTRTQAERVARLLAKQGEVQAGQASRVAEALLRRTRSNREQLSRLLQREINASSARSASPPARRWRGCSSASAPWSRRPSGPAAPPARASDRPPPHRRVAAHVDTDPDHRHKIGVAVRLAGHHPPWARWSRAHRHGQRRHHHRHQYRQRRHRHGQRRLAHRSRSHGAHAAGVAAAPILDRRSGFRHRGRAGRAWAARIAARRSPRRGIDYGAGLPAGQAHQVPLGAASGKPPARQCAPKLVRTHPRQADRGGPLGDDPEDARGVTVPLRPELVLASTGTTPPTSWPPLRSAGRVKAIRLADVAFLRSWVCPCVAGPAWDDDRQMALTSAFPGSADPGRRRWARTAPRA